MVIGRNSTETMQPKSTAIRGGLIGATILCVEG